MTTPSEPPRQTDSSDIECDSVFDYYDRVHEQARGEPRRVVLRTIEVDHGDGDVGIYDAAGNFLACEEGREEALREAEFVLIAYVNGTSWAANELLAGRGHFQQHFPDLAARHGCPPVAPVSSLRSSDQYS